MELPALIQALSQPTAFPQPAGPVDVVHTHISVVFLSGSDVFKVKKPVNLGFLDFSTLEKRRHYCEEEVRLNRRLAPKVYKGIVPITRGGTGLRFGGAGEAIDWAVHMERLPDAARLYERIERGATDAAEVIRFAERLAAFHACAAGGPEVARQARFEGVARNLLDDFDFPAHHVGVTISAPVLERVRRLTEAALAQFQELIESRAAAGRPRDCHGDLHLDHVYVFPEKAAPDDLIAVDCIEFNERFRFIDPVADMAFAYMDLLLLGRDDLAEAFRNAYFAATNDREGEALLPLYTSYRATVRGKVEGLKMDESEVPAEARARAREESAAHWQLALRVLEKPRRRPCLILVGGLPGTGKSTLARTLGEQAGFDVIRSDLVRKQLAREAGVPEQAGSFGDAIYTAEWTEKTYTRCLRDARQAIFLGQRVIIDATFQKDHWRRVFLDAARHWGVPALYLECRAAPNVVRTRLQQRKDDASDADWTVYQMKSAQWEAGSEVTRRCLEEVNTDDDSCVRCAVAALSARGLA